MLQRRRAFNNALHLPPAQHVGFAAVVSQREAVRLRIAGLAPDEVVAWLAAHGVVKRHVLAGGAEVFTFASAVAPVVAFTFVEGKLVLLGDHTTL